MKIYLLLFCFLICTHSVSAQYEIVDSLRSALKTTENPKERFHILNRISDITNFQAGNTDSATCVEMLQIAGDLKNDSLLAVCYNLIGLYFYGKGDNNSALEYLMKAIPLAEKNNDKRRISSLYLDISLVYFNLYNYEEAYKNILKGGENLPDKSFPYYDYMLVQYQRNMTQYFILSDQKDSALIYAQELLNTSLRIKSILFEFAAMYLNGSVYNMSGNNEMAELYFNKAIVLSDSIKMAEEKLKFYESYLDFLLKNGRIEQALDQARELMDLAKINNDINLKMSGAGYLREIFEKMNRTDSAYYYSKLEMELSDQIFSYKNLDKIQALAFDEKLRLIEEETLKKEEDEKHRQRIQYILIAFGIVILILLYLLLSHSFIINERLIEFFGVMALLIIFEFFNLILHPILEKLTNHTPLIMLAALVGIAALLVPLHHKAEKWITAYLVERNKTIRLEKERKRIGELEKV